MGFLFWFLIAFVIYTYIGYPSGLWFLFHFRRKANTCNNRGKHCPFVSVVIAVRNEEKHIRNRILDISHQAYPRDRMELMIVSDGSTDKTNDDIANTKNQESLGSFVTFSSHFPSKGKPFCLNKAASMTKGEIIVFADARQRFSTNAIDMLTARFVDPSIGCVSGELIFEETPGSSIQAEMGAYWKFEKWLRKLESHTGSVPGATGAIYAIRKELFRPIPVETLLDDVLIPMDVCMQGFRTVFEEKAIAYDSYSPNLNFEKIRKVRTLAGNWQLLFLKPALLNPRKNPILLTFLSHKIFRLLVPYCLLTLIVLSLWLETIYASIFLFLFFLGCIFCFVPSFKGMPSFLLKAGNMFRTVLMLNFFAALAPFKLILGSKKLW